MAEVIHQNYHLLTIIDRFGIKLGFGDKTVGLVCNENNINPDFFIEIINSYNFPNYFPKRELQGFPCNMIINYLRKSHQYYLSKNIPKIQSLLIKLPQITPDENIQSLQLLDKFFTEYRNELNIHIHREEQRVYPYVFEVENAYVSRQASPEIMDKIQSYSIRNYKNEHDNIEDKLLDLKNILIKYLPVPVDADLCQEILIELFRLETDLNDHTRMEEKILVPKVLFMEKWLREHYAD